MPEKLVDFYCSQKFTWLSIDLEKKLTYSCCQADSSKIDLVWLKENSGNLFNTDLLKAERQQMLDGIPVKSCSKACWIPESQGFTSRRINLGKERTHTNINATPEILNIILGSSCNLTCSYCCKEYSSAWLHDIKNNGQYLDSERFRLNHIDQILLKISQPEHQRSESFNTLIEEIKTFENIRQVFVTGGEPFLYNMLPSVLENISTAEEIILHTGLGVNLGRLKNQIEKIKHFKNLKIQVSAETIGKLYEFNRFGNTYADFESALQMISDAGIPIRFGAVVSNLTIFGLAEFAYKYKDFPIFYDFCADPDYLKVNVVDPTSKDRLVKEISESTISLKDTIVNDIQAEPTDAQRTQCQLFITEYAKRRNLDLDVFPNSMLQWLNHVV